MFYFKHQIEALEIRRLPIKIIRNERYLVLDTLERQLSWLFNIRYCLFVVIALFLQCTTRYLSLVSSLPYLTRVHTLADWTSLAVFHKSALAFEIAVQQVVALGFAPPATRPLCLESVPVSSAAPVDELLARTCRIVVEPARNERPALASFRRQIAESRSISYVRVIIKYIYIYTLNLPRH